MIVLSTAFKMAQIAVEINGKRKLCELDASCKHSENVLKTLDMMLDEIDECVAENQTYAVVVGPGSFTGLRISTSIVKGLCAGKLDKKVIPLSSLSLIAYTYIKHNKCEKDFVAVINALSGLVFVRKFNSKGEPLDEEKLISIEALDKMSEDKICLSEDNLPFTAININVEDLLAYAYSLEKKRVFCDYRTLAPCYIRKSQAEVQLENKNLKKS